MWGIKISNITIVIIMKSLQSCDLQKTVALMLLNLIQISLVAVDLKTWICCFPGKSSSFIPSKALEEIPSLN